MKIIPIKALRNTNAIAETCLEAQEPIFITRNGFGDMVIMSLDVYNRIVQDRRVDFAIDDYEKQIGEFEDIFNYEEVIQHLKREDIIKRNGRFKD